jgi:hypothetical protein
MDKFHDWQELEKRHSPTYQNMFSRTLILDSIKEQVGRR